MSVRETIDLVDNASAVLDRLASKAASSGRGFDDLRARLAKLKGETAELRTEATALAGGGTAAGGGLAAAAIGISAVATAAVGGVMALGRLAASAQASSAEMKRLGLATADQRAEIEQSSAAVASLGAAWRGVVATVAAGTGGFTNNLFTGMTASLLAFTDVLSGRGLKSLQEYADQVGTLKEGIDDAKDAWGSYWDAVGRMADEGVRKYKQRRAEEAAADARAAAAADALAQIRALASQTVDAGNRSANASRLGQLSGNSPQSRMGAANAARPGMGASGSLGGNTANSDALSSMVDANVRAALTVSSTWAGAAGSIVGSLGAAYAKTEAAQKRWAITSIAINTAAAIMQAAASAPFPYNLGPIALMTALGVAQLAAAAAGTMPKGGLGGGGGVSSSGGTWGNLRQASAMYEPGPQGNYGGGGSARRRGGGEITLKTVAGRYADVRDVIEELDRVGVKLRMARA